MKKIINNLWISNLNEAKKLRYEKKENFDEIISVGYGCNFLLTTKHFKLLDGRSTNPKKNKQIFLSAIKYTYKSYIKGKKILVHCKAGISRSSAVIIGVMMKTGMSYDESLLYLQNIYSRASPNDFFKSILESF